MPAGDDEIYRSLRFNRNEVDFSQWPKLSCSAANELTLATQDDPNPGFARLAIAGELKLQIGVAVNELSSDEKLTNNSDLAIPTQKAVKTYVDNQIAIVNQTLSTKAALDGTTSQDFRSNNLSVSGNLTTNGNVSIGTINSSYKLGIAAGDINIDDGRALRQAGRWVIGGDSKILSIGSSDKSDGRDISFDPGFAGALTIKKDTGNVGLGTTNPVSKLSIFSTQPDQSGGMIHLQVTEPFAGSHRFLTIVKRNSANTAGLNWTFDVSEGDSPGLSIWRALRPNNASPSFVTLLHLTWDGKVGIGTTNPTTTLDIDGDLRIRDPSSIGNIHLFLAHECVQLWSHSTGSGGDRITDVSAYVPATAKGAVIKVIVNSHSDGAGSFVCADRNGNYSKIAHYCQNGFTNYSNTWAGGVVFCPFYRAKAFKWKMVSNNADPSPVASSYGSLIGWF